MAGATDFTNPWYTYPTAVYNDADQDGVADAIDNCQGVYNPQQLDGNTDGAGDCCDTAPGCGGCGQPACDTVCSN